ncbi:MMP9 [Lepeophtheirus salmonis]|uniref:MMP9 n=1 Tax=Lepeophtheirus salmonis TaxID=72036 RepID=A0A7R8CVM8_LEPSM|nr:MMP9 [Lepeophtheirus salmonis]CAF2913875.1 MMP9 [Lepeophtheirus salmonis]
MYDQCTNVDFGNAFWCAVSVNKNGDVRGYGICSSDCPKYANKSGVACIFPYKYNGKTYEAYTTAGNSGFPWCATSLNVPEGYQVFCCPTTNGKTCTFPFSWEGVNFDGCTDASNNGVQWCGVTIGSLDNNIKENMDCSSSCRVAATASNSGCLSTQGLPHILPFIYKGVIYSKCTVQDLGSTFWCATSVNTAGNYLSFSTCSRSCPMETIIPSTQCMTTDNRTCVFPFTYNGLIYTACTTKDNSETPWCATKVGVDANQLTSPEIGQAVSSSPEVWMCLPSPGIEKIPVIVMISARHESKIIADTLKVAELYVKHGGQKSWALHKIPGYRDACLCEDYLKRNE